MQSGLEYRQNRNISFSFSVVKQTFYMERTCDQNIICQGCGEATATTETWLWASQAEGNDIK